MATRGLYVQTLHTGEIHGVQVRDDTGMEWSIGPDTYKLRGYEPAIDSLPDVKDYDGNRSV